MRTATLTALLFIVCGTLPAAEGDLAPTLVIEGTLLAKSSLPRAADIFVYKEGLVTYEYQVDNVLEGSLKDKKILVSHYGIFRDLVQPVTTQEVGAKATLRLRPLDDMGFDAETLPRMADIDNVLSPLFHDVGQQLTYPDSGRWNYRTDVSRNMRAFHQLKNQLKLVVLGDCQGWFSNRTELHYKEENAVTPVALNLCQERSSLSFYQMMVDDYVVKMPKVEWVVVPYHTRWVTDATWKAMHDKTKEFQGSAGYRYDKEHAEEVFQVVEHAPITVEQILAIPELGEAWRKHPWGQLLGAKAGPKARGEAERAKVKQTSINQQRWEQWEAIVKTLADRKIKVLAYTLPIHGATAGMKAKDKAGTSEEAYNEQCKRLKALEETYKGHFFFFDFNNGGKHGMGDSAFGNIDHCSFEGATVCTEAVEAFRLECEKK